MMLNILLKINHSASENDNVIGALIFSIIILSLWIFAGHPFKKKDVKDESIRGKIYRVESQIGFIALIFITIFSIFRSINYFFFE